MHNRAGQMLSCQHHRQSTNWALLMINLIIQIRRSPNNVAANRTKAYVQQQRLYDSYNLNATFFFFHLLLHKVLISVATYLEKPLLADLRH